VGVPLNHDAKLQQKIEIRAFWVEILIFLRKNTSILHLFTIFWGKSIILGCFLVD
jgi:hypothetical protein